MSKFFSSFLPSLRRSSKILQAKFIRDIQSIVSKEKPHRHRWNKKTFNQNLRLFMILNNSVAVPIFFNQERKSFRSTYEVEKEITDMVVKSEQHLIKGDMQAAKKILLDAIKVAESTNVFGNISSVYDLLVAIALQEGGTTEAEDMLANFIDKLLQLGYPEDHNSVVRFKLKLARLYQSIGNKEMAELGYRDCISVQESKLSKTEKPDESTVLIYVNSLFWYAKLLTEKGDFKKANTYMVQTLKKMQSCPLIAPSQIMVVLYHNAEIATILKEYDRALDYLYKALDLCNNKDNQNPDLPLYVVKIGEIFVLKGMLENAEFWCSSANRLSKSYRNDEAEKDSSSCLKQITELRTQKRAQTINQMVKA